MVRIDDAKQLLDQEDHPPKIEKTLYEKYGVPIQHVDFGYVEKCQDGRELEKILQILKSGDEGYYPDLETATENRLAVVKPKSKLLKKLGSVVRSEALTKDERNELNRDLKNWVHTVSGHDSELEVVKKKKINNQIPEVRKNGQCLENKKKTPKRILSTDYSSWDKYDVDTEILKIDIEDEKLKKTVSGKNKKKPARKSVKFKDFDNEVEALHEATIEKEKGNEFFKASDYREALRHYTNSITCQPTVPCLTNRALTFIKLKRYKEAVADCYTALAIEPDNIKAFLRKAQALGGLGKHQEALETAEQIIEIDPNNAIAQDLAEKFRKQCRIVAKTTRFSIEDITKETKSPKRKEKSRVIIPIPGPSTMSPPYYVECSGNNPRKIREETIKANTPDQILHMVSVDSSDDDDDDSCLINHLKRICSDGSLNDNKSKRSAGEVESENREYWNEHSDKSKLVNGIKGRKKNGNKEPTSRLETKNNRQIVNDDKHAGGEPKMKEDSFQVPDDVHSPYSFLRTWNSASSDPSLEQYATILKSVDMTRIVEVIGCKLDSAMFSTIIKCLCMHFAVPGEVETLFVILENLIELPRFDIIAMLMSEDDKTNVKTLLNFLKQHGKYLTETLINKLCRD